MDYTYFVLRFLILGYLYVFLGELLFQFVCVFFLKLIPPIYLGDISRRDIKEIYLGDTPGESTASTDLCIGQGLIRSTLIAR